MATTVLPLREIVGLNSLNRTVQINFNHYGLQLPTMRSMTRPKLFSSLAKAGTMQRSILQDMQKHSTSHIYTQQVEFSYLQCQHDPITDIPEWLLQAPQPNYQNMSAEEFPFLVLALSSKHQGGNKMRFQCCIVVQPMRSLASSIKIATVNKRSGSPYSGKWFLVLAFPRSTGSSFTFSTSARSRFLGPETCQEDGSNRGRLFGNLVCLLMYRACTLKHLNKLWMVMECIKIIELLVLSPCLDVLTLQCTYSTIHSINHHFFNLFMHGRHQEKANCRLATIQLDKSGYNV